jgi:Mn-containing catalase
MDGKGEFTYISDPEPLGPEPTPPAGEPRLHGTNESARAMQQANQQPPAK